MKRRLYIYVCLLLFSNAACYDDLGNYNYNRLPKIVIDSIENNYGTKQLFIDSLIIKPVISFGDEDESSFNKTWYDKRSDTLLPIANTLNLRIRLNDAGSKNYIFEVEHKELGISKRVKTWVTVASGMERGFYILKETAEGNTDLDGHIRLQDEEYQLYPNMISDKLGKPLLGKPVSLDYWNWIYNDLEGGQIIEDERVIRPVSEKDIAVFRMSSFAHIGGKSELFLEEKEMHFEGLRSILGVSFLFSDDGRLTLMPNEMSSRFVSGVNGDYELAPMICAPKSKGSTFVYDKKTSSFMGVGGTTSTILKKLPDMTRENKYMPMNNWNADLKYFGRSEGRMPGHRDSEGIGYALLEKKDDPGALFLLHFTLENAYRNMIDSYSSVERIDTLPRDLNLRKAKHYSVNQGGRILYYTIGSRVFSYDMTTQEEKLVVGESDFSGPTGAPTEITYLKHIYILYEYGFVKMGLFVGGYKDGNYTLYFYKNAKTTEAPLMWTGKGKLKDMRYTSPIPKVDPLYVYQ